ncbi:MAG: hypothetical protein M3P18_16110 [Actinomycetota bacterium]|nr:hypothetical protein [Actinomycetota bacterium]
MALIRSSARALRLRVIDATAFAVLLLILQPARAAAQTPPDDPLARRPFVRRAPGVLGFELRPSWNGSYKSAAFRTNRWGMRDKDYELKPPPRTFRIALVGSSFAVGGGVLEEQTHQSLLEDQLNREGPGAPHRHYEILNFSAPGYGALNDVAVTSQKIFPFAPNAVFLVIHRIERPRMINYLVQLVRGGVSIEYPYINQKLREQGVERGMEEMELRRRVAPIARDIVRWSYQHIAQSCREHRVPVVGIVFPEPKPVQSDELESIAQMASEAGIPLISLNGVYGGYSPDSVTLSHDNRSDPHLNVLGHQLVAARLFQLLRENDARLLKLGFAGSR